MKFWFFGDKFISLHIILILIKSFKTCQFHTKSTYYMVQMFNNKKYIIIVGFEVGVRIKHSLNYKYWKTIVK